MEYTVLVVEDESAVRSAMRLVLEESGHTVIEASDGTTGLELVRTARGPLVVVLDLMLPGMTGIEVLHAASQVPDIAVRAVFVITSVSRAFTIPDLGKYLHGGYLTVLPKPFAIDALLACVDEAGHHLGTLASE